MATSPKFACVLLMCMVVIMSTAPIAQAITCGQVQGNLIPCISYLRNGAWNPGCCVGIRFLSSQATTNLDRRTACTCVKNAAAGISGLKTKLAEGLPSKCGVKIPYKISASTNCAL